MLSKRQRFEIEDPSEAFGKSAFQGRRSDGAKILNAYRLPQVSLSHHSFAPDLPVHLGCQWP
jgi:hypothetical protein